MLDYDPSTKLYLVKRTEIPGKVMEYEREIMTSRMSMRDDKFHSSNGSSIDSSPDKPKTDTESNPDSDKMTKTHSDSIPESHSDSISKAHSDSTTMTRSDSETMDQSEGDAISASESKELASGAETTKQRKASGNRAEKAVMKGSEVIEDEKNKEKVSEPDDKIAKYWVPRIRVMFAAENPKVFANRVAHAHMTRSVHETSKLLLETK